MELPQFLRSKLTEFIDYKISLKQNSNYNVRSEEFGLFNQNTDYESKINSYMTRGKIDDAKKLYKELLDKFSSDLDREVAVKLVSMLQRITSIIKNQLQGYDQEVLLKSEFTRFDKIIEERRLTPSKITGKDSSANFFHSNVSTKKEENAQEPISKPINKINPNKTPIKRIIEKRNRILTVKPKRIRKKAYEPIEQQVMGQAPKKRHQEKVLTTPAYQTTQFVNEEINNLLENIDIAKENIERAIRNQDITVATESYKILRKLFYMVPDEAKEIKSELFSDILSINLRIHILAKEINHIRTNLMEKEKYKRTIEKLLNLKKEKNLLENELYKHEEPEQIQEESEANYYETEIPEITVTNNLENDSKEPTAENEIEKLKRLAKLNRMQHDNNLEKGFPEIKRKPKTFLSVKSRSDDKEIKKIILHHQAGRIDKQMLIKDLYAKGIRNIFGKDKEKAKTYFQRILQINPNYKPALIRLEQIS